MLSVFWQGLLLPLKLYLQPTKFMDEISSWAPELGRGYSFWEARNALREPAFRGNLIRLCAQAAIAVLFWTLAIAEIAMILGIQVSWYKLAFAVAFAVAIGVAGGVALGVAGGVALGVAGGVAWGVAFGVVSGDLGMGVAGGVAWGVWGGVVPGVAVGVAGGVVVGVALGVSGGVALGVAGGTASVITVTHLLNLIPECILSTFSGVVVRLVPGSARRLWALSPPRWDEVILLPLPGLVSLLLSLYRADPRLGREALNEVAAHHYQYRAAYRALLRIAREEAAIVQTLPELARYYSALDWFSQDIALPERQKSLLQTMRDISLECAGALESDSVTNRVHRLQVAEKKLRALQLNPGDQGANLKQWAKVVGVALADARRQMEAEEPIPQVYIKDGKPVRPADGEICSTPFKGRKHLFKELESALGGSEAQRTVLLLYGQRRTGKTSVLLHLPRRLGSHVIPAFLNMQSETLGGARDALGLLIGMADAIIDELRRHGKLTLPGIDRAALDVDPYPAFGRWLDRVEANLGSRILLLCLDEFATLEEALRASRIDTRFLHMLRNIAQHRSQIALLLSGSYQIDELPPHWASALITTRMLSISYLEEADTRELIVCPVDGFPEIYAKEALDRILELTRCQPYLVQVMCAALVERMNKAHRLPPKSFVTKDDVDAVAERVLENGAAYFTDLWKNEVPSDVGQRILACLADAPDYALDIQAVRDRIGDDISLREAIRILHRREIIERDNNAINIAVPLVAQYVISQTGF